MKYAIIPALLLAAWLSPALAQTEPQAPATEVVDAAPAVSLDELRARLNEVKDPDFLTNLIAHYRQTGDVEAELVALDRRIALRPHIGEYKLDKAVTFAREDRKSEGYAVVIELQNSGYDYDLRNDERFKNLSGTEVWEYILTNFDANRQHFGTGELAWTLPREDLLLESLDFDPSRKQLLVGSAREGKVFVVDAKGGITTLASTDAENGMWAVFDLVVDAKRGFLWVASTAVPHFKGYKPEADLGRAGVFKFDLKTGKFIKSYLSPSVPGQMFFLSSIALGSDGAVYAADGVNRAIYQVRDDQFRRIAHLPMLTSISSLALSDDGKRLYFSDPELGVLGLNLATGQPFDVRVPLKLTLQGISAMETLGQDLIVVQSGMNPSRVMRLTLSPEGDAIAGVRPVEANNPLFTAPGAATLDGTTLYVVANDQKDNYDRFGLLKKKELLQGTKIVRIDVDHGAAGDAAPAQ